MGSRLGGQRLPGTLNRAVRTLCPIADLHAANGRHPFGRNLAGPVLGICASGMTRRRPSAAFNRITL